jgi:hypothetical protein
MSEVEFYLGIARALMPNLEKAAVFINRVFAKTVNQRLRFLLQPAIEAIERRDVESAAPMAGPRYSYEQSRRRPGDFP